MLEVVGAVVIGSALGAISGLIPGIHPNTFASILMAITVGGMIDISYGGEVLAIMLLAAAIVHSFVSIVPSVFLGAPEGDTALAVLPSHRLLLKGRGLDAIALSAMGSFSSALLSLGVAIPFVIILSFIYSPIHEYMWVILAVIILIMLFTEVISSTTTKNAIERAIFASLVILLSG